MEGNKRPSTAPNAGETARATKVNHGIQPAETFFSSLLVLLR
jgi:hypothetical protein